MPLVSGPFIKHNYHKYIGCSLTINYCFKKNYCKVSDVLCGACSEENATHWCEECKEWLGKLCVKSHKKLSALKTHKPLTINSKCQEVKDEMQLTIREYTKTIRRIECQIQTLYVTQRESLKKSDYLRHKAIQELNEVFNDVDARIVSFVYDKVHTFKRRQK